MVIKLLLIIKMLFGYAEGTNEINNYYAGLPLIERIEK